MDAAQPAGIQVGDAVVGVGEEEGHDEDEQEGGREEAEAQRALHGRRVAEPGTAPAPAQGAGIGRGRASAGQRGSLQEPEL